jgi:site-specific recombinase XerD
MTMIAPTLQAFFTDRLTRQLQVSPRTIASYRDTLRLLLCFAQQQTGRAPSTLDWEDLDEPLIAAFLDHLERERHNSARTRNLRLTASRSLFRYAALRHPEHAAVIARVLSIPPKRAQRQPVAFLTARESQALIDAPPGTAGRAAATARCCCSPSRPACASQSSPRSTAATSTWPPAPTCASTAKDASSAPSH